MTQLGNIGFLPMIMMSTFTKLWRIKGNFNLQKKVKSTSLPVSFHSVCETWKIYPLGYSGHKV